MSVRETSIEAYDRLTRTGNLQRREGHPIADEWTKLDSGKRIKVYYWQAQP